MNVGGVLYVASDSAVDFLGAIAQNATQLADITISDQGIAAGRRCRSVLRNLMIASTENLDWEVWLFSKTGGVTGVPNTETVRGFWSFVAADAKRIGGAGLYYYYVDGLYVPYEDLGMTGQLHAGLVNRSVAAKTANAGGALIVRFGLEQCNGV